MPHQPKIYILRDGQRHGPYTPEYLRGWLASGHVEADDLAWYEGQAEWLPLTDILARANQLRPAHPCSRCGGELAYVVEKTDTGTGCIVILLGFLLAPLIIGFFIILYGVGMMSNAKTYWHCRGCGTVFPV